MSEGGTAAVRRIIGQKEDQNNMKGQKVRYQRWGEEQVRRSETSDTPDGGGGEAGRLEGQMAAVGRRAGQKIEKVRRSGRGGGEEGRSEDQMRRWGGGQVRRSERSGRSEDQTAAVG